MIIVSGELHVDPTARAGYLEGCREVVAAARRQPGCLDFALTADLLDPGRICVLERWETAAAAEAFRGSGPSDDQQAAIRAATVAEYDVTAGRSLTR